MVPKRRFWNVEKYVGNAFCKHFSSLSTKIDYLGVWKVLTFSSLSTKIDYLGVWKVLTKCITHIFFGRSKIFVWGPWTFIWKYVPECSFGLPKSSFVGAISVCVPNEDFGRPKQARRMRFWTSFQSIVAQNEYSPMWERTFPRNSHAGLGRYFTKLFHTHEYVRFVKWLTQSVVAISRKCCFPHGYSHTWKKPRAMRCSAVQNLRLGA